MPPRTVLTTRDLFLALFVVFFWALSFPVTEGALSALPPFLVAGLRFALVSLCCLVVPRPPLAWRWIVLIGLFLLVGQYGLLYLGMARGMPSGMTALVVQAQVPLTIAIAAVALHERPTARRVGGLAVSALGLVLVGVTRGGAIPLAALLLVLGSGASWAVGNVLIRVAPFTERRADNGFRLVAWTALVPPLPMFVLSLFESVPGRGRGVHADWAALTAAGPRAWLAIGYMVVLGTVAAMSIWSSLLGRYSADRVTPFALGIPVLALLLSRVLIHESISAATLAACAVVLAGLALVALPGRAARREGTESAKAEGASDRHDEGDGHDDGGGNMQSGGNGAGGAPQEVEPITAS